MTVARIRLLGSATLLAVALAACNGDDDPVGPSPTATVYVVHGISGATLATIDATPADVRIGEECVATDLTFGDVSDAVTVNAGAYTVEFRDAAAATPCGGAVLASATSVSVGANQNLSLLGHLNAQGQPQVTRFENDRSAAAGPRIVGRHGAAFGPVDVWLGNQVVFENLANGQQESAITTAGAHTVSVTVTGEEDLLFQTVAPFQNGVVYIAYAVGNPAAETFHVILQTLTMQ